MGRMGRGNMLITSGGERVKEVYIFESNNSLEYRHGIRSKKTKCTSQ